MVPLITCLTVLINLTNEPWNDIDKKNQERAKYVCSTDPRYSDTPCLGKFVKVKPLTYNAICIPNNLN